MNTQELQNRYNVHAICSPVSGMIARAELELFVLRNFGPLLQHTLRLELQLQAAHNANNDLSGENADLQAQLLAIQGGVTTEQPGCSAVAGLLDRPPVAEAAGDVAGAAHHDDPNTPDAAGHVPD